MFFFYCFSCLFARATTESDNLWCCEPNDMQKDEEVEFYREKFAGSQADRIVKAEAEAKKVTDKLKEAKISGFSCFL